MPDGAAREDLLARDPAAQVKPPALRRTPAWFRTVPEVAALLEAAGRTRAAPPLGLIAPTGGRRVEALALTWRDVDCHKRSLTIRSRQARVAGRLFASDPRTVRSRRTPPSSSPVLDLLPEGRVEQARERERVHAANLWSETG